MVRTLEPQPIIPDIAIPTRIIGEDATIYLSDSEILVSSKSEPNRWRIVDLTQHTCTCKGFHYRGCCRHIAAAKVAAEIERREAVPVLPEPTEELVWCGNDYGFVARSEMPKSRR